MVLAPVMGSTVCRDENHAFGIPVMMMMMISILNDKKLCVDVT